MRISMLSRAIDCRPTQDGMKLRSFLTVFLILVFLIPSTGAKDASDRINTLIINEPSARDLRADQPLTFQVAVDANKTYLVEVDQGGLDLVVTVETPDGESRSYNSPLLRDDSELVLLQPADSGVFNITLVSDEYTGAIAHISIQATEVPVSTEAEGERKVCRSMLVCSIIVWLVFQVSEIVVPALSLPLWVNSLVVVLGILGFPIAAMLSWIFDLTPTGLVRDHGSATTTNARPARNRTDLVFDTVLVASAVAICFMLVVSSTAMAQGILDDGIMLGNVRTEYEPTLGTRDNPLTLRYDQEGIEGCKFDSEVSVSGCPGRAGLAANANGLEVWQGNLHWNEACGGSRELAEDTWEACLSYKKSNYYQARSTGTDYWMLIANNDPSFDQCNSGMPGTSLPVVDLASGERGLFQFQVENYSVAGGDDWHRFHFAINSRDHDFFCANLDDYQSSLPFLSIGAQNGAGNDGPVGEIDKWYNYNINDKLSFDYEIVDYSPYTCLPETKATCYEKYAGSHSGFFLVAQWGGTNRMLFVELWRSGHFAQLVYGPARGNWNWPIEESVFFPGAEIAVLPVGHPDVELCRLGIEPFGEADIGSPKSYRVSASDLYSCADGLDLFSSEMPPGRIDLDGVHWFSESYGTDGYLWASLDRASISNMDEYTFSSNLKIPWRFPVNPPPIGRKWQSPE